MKNHINLRLCKHQIQEINKKLQRNFQNIVNLILIKSFEIGSFAIFHCWECKELKKLQLGGNAMCSCKKEMETFCPNCGNFFSEAPKTHLKECKFPYLKNGKDFHLFYFDWVHPSCLHHLIDPKKRLLSMEKILRMVTSFIRKKSHVFFSKSVINNPRL